ncbi:MAG: NAD(P)-dependent alcohol dehydrogenase [Ferruginibacter sp.]|nr:NAD(P)-dependent alcohol dehydrogenase [Chitinophagaceae bacterium]
MKAIVYTKYGPPEVLQLKEVEKPAPKDNEVLVSVKATTVNRTDCAILRAKPFIMRFGIGLLKPNKPIMGTEFAGKVEAVGKNVTSFKAGDKVFGFNDMVLSAYAQYMTIAADKALATIPENISYEQAAASCEGAHYAYNMINKIKLKPGQKVLVNGASGGIGSAAVQLLKYFGADVVAVCSTKNIELVKGLGADRVIDYTAADFTKEHEKYDFIFDTVGKSSFSKCRPLLNPGGRYLSSELGWMAQNIFFALISPIMGSKKVIFPIPKDIKGSIALIKKLIAGGKFKAVIDREYPLEKIAEAFKYVETGEKTGNVVITLEDKTS